MTETAQQPAAPEPPAPGRLGHCPWPHGVVELRKRREAGTWQQASEALREATTPDGPDERNEPPGDGP
ncbi:hypothetical protein ACIGFK_01220 [Streptomyces sp. NPDC085524]|uniref:hypothetical protein n=1 Tax=unclassified Streptomyces TaxID=2593676 RepID=UPI0035D6F577